MVASKITKTDARKVKKALRDADLPCSLAAVAKKVRDERADPAELARDIDAAAKGAVAKRPSTDEGPKKVAALPDELIAAVVERAKHGDARVNEAIDRVVTSRAGYRVMAKRFGALDDPTTETLAGQLAAGARRDDPGLDRDASLRAGEYVAYRTQGLMHLMRRSAGPMRDWLKKSLGKIAPAANPAGPVNVTPTAYTQRWVKVGRTWLRYIDVGAGPGEPILLVHGHGSLLEEYEALVPLLAKRHRVIVPDLPGCGYSDKPARRYSVGYFEKTLVALLDALQIPRCIVMGGSLGGNLTLRFGLNQHARTSEIVPWAPAGWIGTDDLLAFGARVARDLGPWMFWLSYNEQKDAWYSEDWPGRAEALRQSDLFRNEVYCEPYHRAYFEIAAEQTGRTLAPRAADVKAPTLLMCGRHDDALGMWETVSTVLAPTIPDCVFESKFRYGRHSLAAEDTEQVAKYALGYLAR